MVIGAKRLVVEVDAQYIKGMLNKPDIHPNAAMNRWISAILLFDFELVHVPGNKHKGPDGLSRRRVAEEWVDEVLGCGVWVAGTWEVLNGRVQVWMTGERAEEDEGIMVEKKGEEDGLGGYLETRGDEESRRKDDELELVRNFLETMKMPRGLTEKARGSFIKRVSKFFSSGGKLWKKEHMGRHQQVVMTRQDRYRLLIKSHDRLGHKGFYATRRTLLDRFWWPNIDADIRWFINTCHQCQIRSLEHVVLPPIVQTPAPLFRKVYIDMMHMPLSHGHKYIVQACCSLTGWVEW